jgi:hypothetical protein
MPTDPKYTSKKPSEPGGVISDEPAAVVDDRGRPVSAAAPQPLYTTPIVLERRRSKKQRHRRYTSGTRTAQRIGLGLVKATYRVTDSFAEGFQTFSKRSSKSADRRKDGFVRDSLRNASAGIQDGLNELGRAPGELAKRIPTNIVWNTFRFFTLS